VEALCVVVGVTTTTTTTTTTIDIIDTGQVSESFALELEVAWCVVRGCVMIYFYKQMTT
jgi:hypothetical protein